MSLSFLLTVKHAYVRYTIDVCIYVIRTLEMAWHGEHAVDIIYHIAGNVLSNLRELVKLINKNVVYRPTNVSFKMQ